MSAGGAPLGVGRHGAKPMIRAVRVRSHVVNCHPWETKVATHQPMKKFHDSAVPDQLVEFRGAGQDIVIDGLVRTKVKSESLFLRTIMIIQIEIIVHLPVSQYFAQWDITIFSEKLVIFVFMASPSKLLFSIETSTEECNCEISATLKISLYENYCKSFPDNPHYFNRQVPIET